MCVTDLMSPCKPVSSNFGVCSVLISGPCFYAKNGFKVGVPRRVGEHWGNASADSSVL
jgi:hypothetical protein